MGEGAGCERGKGRVGLRREVEWNVSVEERGGVGGRVNGVCEGKSGV